MKVFFYGMEQLLAHFISCYRDELLTHFDYLVCLGQLSVELVQALVLSCQAILPLLYAEILLLTIILLTQAVPEVFEGVPAATALL